MFWDKKNLVREVDVHEVDQEEKRVGSHERLSANSVNQRECLEKTNFARDRLLEGARDHLQALCDQNFDGNQDFETRISNINTKTPFF